MLELKDQKVCVIGAGLMGTGIAHAFASKGVQTVLVDTAQDALDRARKEISAITVAGVKLGKISEAAAAAAGAALTVDRDLSQAAADAHLVVETVSETLAVKKAVIETADAVMAPGGVIGTNTSALSVTEIAIAARDPGAVVGLHFFNPVHKMRLLEIVAGLQTRPDILQRARDWSSLLGKTSILVNDTPGLTTSRMSVLLGNEAMHMLMEGTASAEDIDTALRLGFGHPMGPLETGDLTGWDTRLSVLNHLHKTLGEKFRPCPLILKMVAAGRFGRKSGTGVYRYENGVRVPGSGLKASAL